MAKATDKGAQVESLPNSVFNRLSQVDVSDFTEEKNGLTYLTWSYAFFEVLKRYYSGVKFGIRRFDNTYLYEGEPGNTGFPYVIKDQPYLFDPLLGYLVETWVEIDGVRYEMQLPVMDGANKAQKHHQYTYKGWEYVTVPGQQKKQKKQVDKVVEAATMFDINTTIMRCYVKNLAMHGVGLNIYAGTDLLNLGGEIVDDVVAVPTEAVQQPEVKTAPADKPKRNTTKRVDEKPAPPATKPGEMPDDSGLPTQPITEAEITKKAETGKSLTEQIEAATNWEEVFAVLDTLPEAKVLATGTMHRNWKFKNMKEVKEKMAAADFTLGKPGILALVNHYTP